MLDNDAGGSGRSNQKTRTRQAIIDACRALIRTGALVTMPEVAHQALVSEATAYRYFPDLLTLMNAALVGLWPAPSEAFVPLRHVSEPSERIAFAAEFFLRRIIAYQGAVRVMIAATITQPALAVARPGLRFAWIEYALTPPEPTLPFAAEDALARLKYDLAVVVSPEALFTLMDLCGLSADAAITHAARLATTLTSLAFMAASTTQS